MYAASASSVLLTLLLAVAQPALSTRSMGNASDLEVDYLQEAGWKSCRWMKSWIGHKRYRMEYMDDGVPVTVLFNRFKKRPELKLSRGKTWKVNLYTPGVNPLQQALGTYKGKLQWETVLAKGFEPEDVKDETIGLEDAAYVRYVDKSMPHGLPAMLLIGQESTSTPVVFAGGDYYNDELIRMSMKRIKSDERREGKLPAEIAGQKPAGVAGAGQAVSSFGNAIGYAAGTTATVGGVMGGSIAFLSTGLLVTTTEVVVSATVFGASAGFVGGAGLGLAVGAVGGAVSGLATGIFKFVKLRHEASLTMPEKIFEKLRCHPNFISCAGNVLYPKSKLSRCPSKTLPLAGQDQMLEIIQKVM